MKRLYLYHIACCSVLLCSGAAWAQEHPHAGHGMAAPAVQGAGQSAAALAEGEVIEVDVAGKKVTLRHGEIKNLNMPPMAAMPFHVKDQALLEQLKPGQKIRFTASHINGVFTMTSVQPAH
jgi:Cu/Ag efflux protein CusF